MQPLIRRKIWTALLAMLSLGALLALSMTLRDVTFRPAHIFGQREAVTIQFAIATVVGMIRDAAWWEQLILWTVLFLIVVLIGLLLTPQGRRRLIQGFLRMAAIFWAVYLLLKYRGDLLARLNPNLTIPSLSAADGGLPAPPPGFSPPQLPGYVFFAVSLVLAFGLILLLMAVRRWWGREQGATLAPPPLEELADAARSTLADLRAGREWDSVIIDCYTRMSRAVEERRGLYRQQAMTPTEFVARLEQAGLPPDAVRGLTALFERVRYGTHRSNQTDVDQAVTWLTAILHSCGERA